VSKDTLETPGPGAYETSQILAKSSTPGTSMFLNEKSTTSATEKPFGSSIPRFRYRDKTQNNRGLIHSNEDSFDLRPEEA